MRLIPVIDIRGGVAVHAVAGQRDSYQAVRSVLTRSADPVVVARDLHDTLGNTEVYVADLDCIERPDQTGRLLSPAAVATIEWAAGAGVTVLLDAGVSSMAVALTIGQYAAVRLIIGTETLTDMRVLGEIVTSMEVGRVVASLDLRDQQVLARSAELRDVAAERAAGLLIAQGVDEMIVLDLARVGTGAGTTAGLIAALSVQYPHVAMLAGGGVRRVADLEALSRAGAAGALVATALHTGAITAEDWIHYAG